MWRIQTLDVRQTELDFTSVGLGKHRDEALLADGTVLVNALELAELGDDPVQVLVCETCGHTGCAPGGWVTLRRVEDGVLLLPAFQAMSEGDRERGEYSPPAYIRSKGIPFTAGRLYESLAAGEGGWPFRRPIFADETIVLEWLVIKVTGNSKLGGDIVDLRGRILGEDGKISLGAKGRVLVTDDL